MNSKIMFVLIICIYLDVLRKTMNQIWIEEIQTILTMVVFILRYRQELYDKNNTVLSLTQAMVYMSFALYVTLPVVIFNKN